MEDINTELLESEQENYSVIEKIKIENQEEQTALFEKQKILSKMREDIWKIAEINDEQPMKIEISDEPIEGSFDITYSIRKKKDDQSRREWSIKFIENDIKNSKAFYVLLKIAKTGNLVIFCKDNIKAEIVKYLLQKVILTKKFVNFNFFKK
jgi:hypothetical protein